MLNKKDPLIESVQKIMLENEIRRTVTNNLNEELGIQSINNLPHELHEKYTAILEQNITAALLGEKVEMSKKQFANLDGKPEFTGRDLELARAGHHKKLAAAGKLEELKTDPYAEKDAGHDVVTPVEPTVNRAGKRNNLAPGMARAENIAKQGDSVVTRTGKNSSSVSPSTMKEEQLNELSPGTYAGYLAKADSDVDTAQEFNRTYYRKPETGRRAILSKYKKGIERATSSLYKKGMSSKGMEDAVRSAREKIPDMEPKKILPRNVKEEALNEKITGKTDIGDAIKDFRASKSKQLAGRSSEERRKAAIAAVLQARREKK